MDKIPFVDGTKISNAKVTINEQEYEVTPAQYQGTTPMSAFNLNKMQDNIEKAINEVDKKIITKAIISLNIKEQVNITMQNQQVLVPMANPTVNIGNKFQLLSDGTVKVLEDMTIFIFAQIQINVNSGDNARLYIFKNDSGIAAEKGIGSKAYQAAGIASVNAGDIIKITIMNNSASNGNTDTSAIFNHLEIFEI